jgi:ketosteroid isomerase-like protein
MAGPMPTEPDRFLPPIHRVAVSSGECRCERLVAGEKVSPWPEGPAWRQHGHTVEEKHLMSDERLEMVQTFFTRYFEGHVDEAVALLEPSVVYHLPGRTGPTGDFVGPTAVAEHLQKFLKLTEGSIDVLSWDDWLIGTTDIAGVVRLHLQRPGRIQECRVVFLVEVSQNVKIARVECFYSDPEAFERFFSW